MSIPNYLFPSCITKAVLCACFSDSDVDCGKMADFTSYIQRVSKKLKMQISIFCVAYSPSLLHLLRKPGFVQEM